MSPLTSKRIAELLKAHSDAITELCALGVLRTKNNPTGDYAEWLVSKHVGLTLAANSAKGFDATDRHGALYQIKGRRITHLRSSIFANASVEDITLPLRITSQP